MAVLGPSDIARRRMIPAIIKSEYCEYAGVAVATAEERTFGHEKSFSDEKQISHDKGLVKAVEIQGEYGGEVYDGYMNMLKRNDIDAVYVALPPALHYRWGLEVLKNGKHLLMEKPFTTDIKDTETLICCAKENDLAVIENFGFKYHDQMVKIHEMIDSGVIGDIRLIRSNFGFPHRAKDDFRHNSALGGGALLDCGCYTIKLIQELMGSDIDIVQASLFGLPDHEVDMYGVITAVDENGTTAQLSFDMDQQYCCEADIWGSKGSISSNRIYTAPADYETELSVCSGMDRQTVKIGPVDQFLKTADKLAVMALGMESKQDIYDEVIRQGRLVEKCISLQSRVEY